MNVRTAIAVIALLFIAGAGLGGIAGGALVSTAGSGKLWIAATMAGTLTRLFIGSEIGASLDRADRLFAGLTPLAEMETRSSGTPLQIGRRLILPGIPRQHHRQRTPRASSRQHLPHAGWFVASVELTRARPGHTARHRCSSHRHEQRRSIHLSLYGPNVPAPFGCRAASGARAGARGS